MFSESSKVRLQTHSWPGFPCMPEMHRAWDTPRIGATISQYGTGILHHQLYQKSRNRPWCSTTTGASIAHQSFVLPSIQKVDQVLRQCLCEPQGYLSISSHKHRNIQSIGGLSHLSLRSFLLQTTMWYTELWQTTWNGLYALINWVGFGFRIWGFVFPFLCWIMFASYSGCWMWAAELCQRGQCCQRISAQKSDSGQPSFLCPSSSPMVACQCRQEHSSEVHCRTGIAERHAFSQLVHLQSGWRQHVQPDIPNVCNAPAWSLTWLNTAS